MVRNSSSKMMVCHALSQTYDFKKPTNRIATLYIGIVSFAEYSLFYRALLQKRPVILRSLLIVATPYEYHAKGCKYIRVVTHTTPRTLTQISCASRASQ